MRPSDSLEIDSENSCRSDLRSYLRAQTRPEHDALDTAMSRFDLETERGYRAFLATNLLAWSCLAGHWESFLAETLRTDAPDYCALLEQDLAELGSDNANGLPPISPPHIACPGGMAYVLAGSRMGMATIRKRPNWGARTGRARRFVEDRAGPNLFRTVIAHLESLPQDKASRAASAESATLTFDIFRCALEQVKAA